MTKNHRCTAVFALLSFLIAEATAALSGCRAQKTLPAKDKQRISIAATFYPLYIMLLNITSDVPDVKLSLIAPASTGCLHDYQMTAKDMKAISDCDVLVANGAGMEDFLEEALMQKKDALIVASDGFPLVNANAHVWVSLRGAISETQNIADGLCRLDPGFEGQYASNASFYIERLETLEKRMHESLDAFAGKAIITFHEAFAYFAAEFGLDVIATIERDAGVSPSAKEIESLISKVKAQRESGHSVALLAEPQYPRTSADVIASETGLSVYELDPAVTGELKADAYLGAMEKNLHVLESALAGKR